MGVGVDERRQMRCGSLRCFTLLNIDDVSMR